MENKNIASISYEVKDLTINDKENSKLKGNVTIPQVFVNGEALTDINKKIEDEYKNRFEKLKEQMKSAENKFTYKVTYNKYENNLGDKKVLSLTIYQRVIDDSTKETTTDKVETYNINLEAGKLIEETDAMFELYGKDYKEKVKESIKSYVVSKGYIKKDDFTYTMTGFENYYIKEGKLHMLFNEDEIVDKKHGVLDITIE